MKRALPESLKLLQLLLSNEEKETITLVLRKIDENPNNYEINEYWQLDSSIGGIGGIGGYCMPANPVKILFLEVWEETYLDHYNMLELKSI